MKKAFRVIGIIVVILVIGFVYITFFTGPAGRPKGSNAIVKANLSNIRPQAELIKEEQNSYENICTDSVIAKMLSQVDQNNSDELKCYSNKNTFVVATGFKYKTEKTDYWCVDSTGTMIGIDRSQFNTITNATTLCSQDTAGLPDGPSWIHSYEEDKNGIEVYRRENTYNFPPARFRDEFAYRGDNSCAIWFPGANDMPDSKMVSCMMTMVGAKQHFTLDGKEYTVIQKTDRVLELKASVPQSAREDNAQWQTVTVKGIAIPYPKGWSVIAPTASSSDCMSINCETSTSSSGKLSYQLYDPNASKEGTGSTIFVSGYACGKNTENSAIPCPVEENPDLGGLFKTYQVGECLKIQTRSASSATVDVFNHIKATVKPQIMTNCN